MSLVANPLGSCRLPLGVLRSDAATRLRCQRTQLIPERVKRRIELRVPVGQRAERIQLQPKTGAPHTLRHPVDDAVCLKSHVVVNRSFAYCVHQRHEELDWVSVCRGLHEHIVRRSNPPCHPKVVARCAERQVDDRTGVGPAGTSFWRSPCGPSLATRNPTANFLRLPSRDAGRKLHRRRKVPRLHAPPKRRF